MTVVKSVDSSIVNIVDIVADIVAKVRLEYDQSNETPYFLHGHPLEIINTLKEYTQSSQLRTKKFPLIALFEDIESSGKEGIFASQSKLNILFITDTLPTYKAAERYEKSFNPVLTPLYNLFIKYYLSSRAIYTPNRKVDCTVIDHLFWGRKGLYGSTANFFEDCIDAKEIKNLDFKVFRNS
jgi:uncharacterized protein (UPF0262 family)